ncbi:hypothetical protein Taro_024626 [Colocasia esculenta]|uniref:Uncharacterized protein n=1 Tax=Colocasia esculenta TaxID=4460 RepID=A0A843V0V6_COLES|nr:hypothetical protein [Colocasia esculenta]
MVAPVGVVSLTSWSVRGARWFCLWTLDLVEVRGGCACGETLLLTWLLGVSRGDTWLFLPDLVEVCVEGCCHIVFDSAGSTGVVFGPTLVVVEAFLYFRCFVVLCGRHFPLYCFIE